MRGIRLRCICLVRVWTTRPRGGDADLLIEADQRLSRIEQGRIKMELEQVLGLPVDILVQVRNAEPTPFQTIAKAHAKRLEMRL